MANLKKMYIQSDQFWRSATKPFDMWAYNPPNQYENIISCKILIGSEVTKLLKKISFGTFVTRSIWKTMSVDNLNIFTCLFVCQQPYVRNL